MRYNDSNRGKPGFYRVTKRQLWVSDIIDKYMTGMS